MAEVDAFPDSVIYYGVKDPLPVTIPLRAGFLDMIYEAGALRYIKSGGQELLRMMYVALRDSNWGTHLPHISHEIIDIEQDSFRISYTCSYVKENVLIFTWKALITGEANGTIYFEMKGKANADFQKNRLGFCILHPIHECQGREIKIIHPNDTHTTGQFPVSISPHQPFKNIQQMQWQLENGTSATLTFSGDIFEMEDQRNWTDASYKTYCTPLEIPFPANMEEGQELFQSVRLEVKPSATSTIPTPTEAFVLKADWNAVFLPPLPKIGIGRSSEYNSLTGEEVEKIKLCKFSHYRSEIDFHSKEWKTDLANAILEANQLEISLEIALFVDEKASEIEAFLDEAARTHNQIKSIILFFPAKTNDRALEERLVTLFKHKLSNLEIGIGRKGVFTELNRSRPASKLHDFIAFAINPQAHAFDNSTLVENLEAQAFAIDTAKEIAGNKLIHISPVTLRSKSKTQHSNPEVLPLGAEHRQMSLLTAGWTIGSIKYLAESGTASVTYYETIGKKGIMAGQYELTKDSFPAFPHMIYPVYYVFKEIGNIGEAQVIPCSTGFPLQLSALLLKTPTQFKLLLANHTQRALIVNLADLGKMWKAKVLDKNSFKQLAVNAGSMEFISEVDTADSITLPAFAVAFLSAKLNN